MGHRIGFYGYPTAHPPQLNLTPAPPPRQRIGREIADAGHWRLALLPFPPTKAMRASLLAIPALAISSNFISSRGTCDHSH